LKTVFLCDVSSRHILYLKLQKVDKGDETLGAETVTSQHPGFCHFKQYLRRIEALHTKTVFTIITLVIMLNLIEEINSLNI